MAAIQGPAKKGSIEKKTLHERMDRLFRISPLKVTVRNPDGSSEKVTIEHRIGREAGHLTRFELMDKLGLEDQFAEFTKDMTKKIRDEERLKEVLDDKYSVLKSKMTRAVQDYRKYLEGHYANNPGRPMIPLFAFVPVTEKDDGLYIQSLVDEDHKHLIGDPNDTCLWFEVLATRTKRFADEYKRAQLTAAALMLYPGINKDLRQRAAAISQGKLPERLGYSPEKK